MPCPGDIVANEPDMVPALIELMFNKEKAHKKSTSKLTSDRGSAMKSSKCVDRRLRGSMSGGDQ